MAAALRSALAGFPAVVVTGARQTGRTTLLRQELAGTHRYVTLEDPDARSRATSDPRAFLRTHSPPLILDEIQNAPEILSYIKTAIDEDRAPGRWIMTGSQTFALMSNVSQSLAGRAAILHLMGLAAAEIPMSLRLSTADELLRGSFPQPRLDQGLDWRLWMSSYVQSYLERDVRSLTQVTDLQTFETFLRLCAARTAQLLNLHELARDAGVSPTTATRWLSVLETSGVLYRLTPWSRSTSKRLVKSPKL